ncbi:hypothetical protein AAF712_016180 [Marasmius tenuissimus]|uniref:Uncharacterized protein n=1 Tax=Marasmius tenuissimus TaxID=585030 RepID=A0ABR2Z7D9_9AGAR
MRVTGTPAPPKTTTPPPNDVSSSQDKPTSRNHRTREKERHTQGNNLKQLISACTGAEFWRLIRKWTDDKSRPAKVTADQLKEVFHARLNLVIPTPAHFNTSYQHLYEATAAAIPSRTMDRSASQVWSRDISLEEIAKVKEKTEEALNSVSCWYG